MTNNPYGERMEELFQCENCGPTKPTGTETTRAGNLMSLK